MKKRHYIELVLLLVITFIYVFLKTGTLPIKRNLQGRLTFRDQEKELQHAYYYSFQESDRVWIRSEVIRYFLIENGKLIFATNLPNAVEFDLIYYKWEK